jgi:hypothetical protein
MKKLITFLLFAALFQQTANAATYYVNIGLAAGNNNGSSWADAYQTFDAAATAASNNAGADNIFIKGAISKSNAWNMSIDNYYGSFEGWESSTIQRPMNDNDGNGIIEPWEFKYPTTFTSTNNATAINGSASILDGFTITHSGTVNGTTAMTTLISPVGQTVQNCVFYGSTLSYGATTVYTNSNGGCLLKVLGTFQNNLIEKNNVSITYGSTDIKIAPILDVNCSASGTPAVSISGCFFRNNKATISNTGAVAAPTNLKGTILNITANDPAATVSFRNLLVHNNEVNYTGSASFPTATRASIAGSLNFGSSNTSDSYINCLFANNKMTNMLSCMHVMANIYVVHKGYNNVFWNNQNNGSGVSMSSSSSQNINSVFNNNYLDVAKSGSWDNGATIIWQSANQTNLSKSNTGANSPLFKNPPIKSSANFIGSAFTTPSDSTFIKQADWRINVTSGTSYLYQHLHLKYYLLHLTKHHLN